MKYGKRQVFEIKKTGGLTEKVAGYVIGNWAYHNEWDYQRWFGIIYLPAGMCIPARCYGRDAALAMVLALPETVEFADSGYVTRESETELKRAMLSMEGHSNVYLNGDVDAWRNTVDAHDGLKSQ